MPRATTILFALLSLLPLSAHDHGCRRGPRRVIVLERPAYGDPGPWVDEGFRPRSWERDRPYRRWVRRHDCDDDGVIFAPLPRPLLPPIQGRVVIRLR